MRTTLLLMTTLILTACVTARPVALPDGRQGYTIHCPGTARDIGDCMNKAAQVCGGAYQVMDRETESRGGFASVSGNSAVFIHGVDRTLVVGCGAG